MFCPKCSEAQVSEDTRFCKRCGFRLEPVRDLIAEDAITKSRSNGPLPQQSHISIGAGLMFIGNVAAMFWARAHLGADGDVLPQVFLILGFTLGFILLLFHPLLAGLKNLFSDSDARSDARKGGKSASISAKERDGINLGALLMFLGSVKALALSTMINDPARRPGLTVAISAGMLLILLISRWLIGGFYRLFLEDSVTEFKAQSDRVTADLAAEFRGAASGPELPAAQHDGAIPIEAFAVRKGEVVQPPSVTEKTTSLLDKG